MKESENSGFVMVPLHQLRVLEEKVDKVLSYIEKEKSRVKYIEGWVTEKEAMKILGRGVSWFWKNGKEQLGGKKRGHSWWYPLDSLKKYIEGNLK